MNYSVTNHPKFSELWDAQALARNVLIDMLIRNGLEKEIQKVEELEKTQYELQAIYREVDFKNGELHAIWKLENFLEAKITFTKEESS